jgi:transcriptional regulator with XRE-family HTH domain
MIPKLTGNLFRAGRALAGLTRTDLASRSGLSPDVLRSWEISSESIVPAQYQILCRAIDALEAEASALPRVACICNALHRPAPSFTAREPRHERSWKPNEFAASPDEEFCGRWIGVPKLAVSRLPSAEREKTLQAI